VSLRAEPLGLVALERDARSRREARGSACASQQGVRRLLSQVYDRRSGKAHVSGWRRVAHLSELVSLDVFVVWLLAVGLLVHLYSGSGLRADTAFGLFRDYSDGRRAAWR